MQQTNAYPTKLEVLEATRSLLGDVRQAGGKLYSDEILELPLRSAVRSVMRVLRNIGDFHVIRTGYTKLPAHQNVLIPASAGFADFLAPIEMAVRTDVSFYTVSNAEKNGRNLDLTLTAAHTIPTGEYALVTATDIAGFPAVFGEYQGYGVSDTIIRLLGCDVTGTWVTDTSKLNQVGIGTSSFSEVVWARDIGNINRDNYLSRIGQVEPKFDFTGGRFNFHPADVDVQLRIRYQSMSNMPTDYTDYVEIPDSLDFLSIHTAMTATITRMPAISASLRLKLWGNGREDTPDDGIARSLALAVTKSQVNLRYQDRTRPGYTTVNTRWI